MVVQGIRHFKVELPVRIQSYARYHHTPEETENPCGYHTRQTAESLALPTIEKDEYKNQKEIRLYHEGDPKGHAPQEIR